jgi:hypothetical protein
MAVSRAKWGAKWGALGAGALLPALLLAGCVDSAEPLIGDAQPNFGPQVRVHVYTLGEGGAEGPSIEIFRWKDGAYRAVSRPTFEVAAFAAAPFAGNDLIIQSWSANPKIKGFEYAIARKLADNVYMVRVIDEDDADAETRAKLCTVGGSDSCRITSREALLTLARASAAKSEFKGSIAIIVGEPGK